MKKLISTILMISIFLSSFIPLFPMELEAASCDYEVVNIKSDGTFPLISCHTSYDTARAAMLAHASTTDSVAGVYNSTGKLLIAKYAIARLKKTSGDTIYIYKDKNDTTSYTYTEPDYGVDAAILDYDIVKNRYQIKLSGVTGWVPAGNVNVTPISNVNAQTKTTTGALGTLTPNYSSINIRKTPDATITTNKIRTTDIGEVFNYYEVKNTGDKLGRLWYRVIIEDGTVGWIANEYDADDKQYWVNISTTTTATKLDLKTRFMIEKEVIGSNTYYNLRQYYMYRTSLGSLPVSSRILGFAPRELYETSGVPSTTKNFYSFDGNFFYTKITDMIDDYRADASKTLSPIATTILTQINQKAINKGKPYFAYNMYLPTHSKTGYLGSDFNQDVINKGFTAFPNADRSLYVQCERDTAGVCKKDVDGNTIFISSWVTGVSRTGLSLLYGQGNNLVSVANTYGINALLMYATALNESANGTSIIGFAKNNLFGIGATDSAPFTGAHRYATVKDSFIGFAQLTGTSYSTPTSSVYHSSHYGNKNSGMNISYASDPYWGLKKAANSHALDSTFGYNDDGANTIGIKLTSSAIPIKKLPSSTSATIYELRNINKLVSNMSMIITDRVKDASGNYWYKIYTDSSLDANQIFSSSLYNFSTSYGYVEAKYIYTSNTQPIINASNIVIRQTENINLLDGVTAIDAEDGNITSKIDVEGSYDSSTIGSYNITYNVEDNSRFSASKTIKVEVLPSDRPLIYAFDQDITVGGTFDSLKGVLANDFKDGNVSVTVVSNNVNTAVIGSYTVTYKAVNSLGKETLKTITVYVVANQKPVITAINQTIPLNSVFTPLKYASAVDAEEGDLTSKITVSSNPVKTNVAGTYKVTYRVVDSANNVVTHDIYVTVESKTFTKKTGEFYFEKLNWNTTSKRLEVQGSLAIVGINNNSAANTQYDLIVKSNTNNTQYIKPLERWLVGAPTRKYSDSKYDYSATWFKGSIDMSDVVRGEYTLYIRARSGSYESLNLFRNMFEKTMSRKIENNGNSYQFRSNNYKREYPIELFVKDESLTTNVPTNAANMINNYRTLAFNGKFLNIVGNSFNVGVNYSSTATVKREIIFENIATGKRYTYDVGSYVGTDIPLRVSDGLSKVRGWYDTTNKIDVTNIEKGKYVIYIRTASGTFVDHGELTDVFLKSLTTKTTVAGKTYSVSLNKDLRFRIELDVK